MMRFFSNICLVITLLSLIHAGCSRPARYDNRLTKADSLMTVGMTDSALSMLSSIIPNSLSSEGDQAYHALLTTQARYKSYALFTSDDEINTAVKYYDHHADER